MLKHMPKSKGNFADLNPAKKHLERKIQETSEDSQIRENSSVLKKVFKEDTAARNHGSLSDLMILR
jgi:hypothetical protein